MEGLAWDWVKVIFSAGFAICTLGYLVNGLTTLATGLKKLQEDLTTLNIKLIENRLAIHKEIELVSLSIARIQEQLAWINKRENHE